MIENAEIIISKESGTVPKNTAYQFPFQIIAPDYDGEIITRDANIEENEVDDGKIVDFDIHRDKFNPVKSVILTQLDKYLLFDGLSIWTIKGIDYVQLPITNPTKQDFLEYGFDENVFIGEISRSVQMQQTGQTDNGYIYEVKIPTLFNTITNIHKELGGG